MYARFYGLRERPFDLTPNPRYLLLTGKHREALGNIEYGIRARKGITVLIGEAGTGKTTLIRTALARGNANVQSGAASWAYLKNPVLRRSEFLEFLALRFGLPADVAASKTRLLDALEHVLAERPGAALVVDEAQSIPNELLEEIRLLANIESDAEKLLPVVLVGQPELSDRLNEPSLRQLKQRITLRCTLPSLSLHECAAYIATRIEIAGGDPGRLFSKEAVLAVYQRSAGIPRTISVICDNALLTGYAADRRPVDADVVEAVCRDFDLPRRMLNIPAVVPIDRPTASEQHSGRVVTESPISATGSVLAELLRRRWALKRRCS